MSARQSLRAFVRRAKSLVRGLVLLVRLCRRSLQCASCQRRLRRSREVAERTGSNRGEKRRSVRWPFFSIHRSHRNTEHLSLKASQEGTPGAATREQQV